ncbi:MAG: ATP-binding protein [Betaproteobacteria bacterium]|nr:ATP-binding protein [Betaproteobacteria bacterium]
MATIRPKERDALLQSMRAGVVPRVGQRLVQVGRAKEVAALLQEIERVADGGSAFRLVIGEYGSGKTFFLNLIRSIALEKKLVTANADLNPDRRLHSTGGQARSLYAELMKNLSTRTKPDGGALPAVVERFVSEAAQEARRSGAKTENVIHQRLENLKEMVNGYDFADVVEAYWRGHETDNEQLKSDAVRWLRAEFSTKSDARKSLGVRTIIDDANGYDMLKLTARFVRLAGFSGLMVCFDELVNLYKLAHTQSRNGNYEQILRILNDSLQGNSVGLGILLGGTPEFLMDTRRGLYSYAALASRLTENRFAKDGLVDFSGPVLRLSNLTKEEFYLLLEKLRYVFAYGDPKKFLVPDEALPAFMGHCSKRIGDAYFRTPRNTITAFVHLLSVLEQNSSAKWTDLLDAMELRKDDEGGMTTEAGGASGNDGAVSDDDNLASFKL